MKFATKTIHAAQPSEPETGSLVAPIFQTSTYEQESPGQDKGFNYSRTNNPSRQRLEIRTCRTRGGKACSRLRFRPGRRKRRPASLSASGRRNCVAD